MAQKDQWYYAMYKKHYEVFLWYFKVLQTLQVDAQTLNRLRWANQHSAQKIRIVAELLKPKRLDALPRFLQEIDAIVAAMEQYGKHLGKPVFYKKIYHFVRYQDITNNFLEHAVTFFDIQSSRIMPELLGLDPTVLLQFLQQRIHVALQDIPSQIKEAYPSIINKLP